MGKHIECGDPVGLLVHDYKDGLPILMLYRNQHSDISLDVAKWTVENVPFYFADDLIRQEADELALKLILLGAEVEIV